MSLATSDILKYVQIEIPYKEEFQGKDNVTLLFDEYVQSKTEPVLLLSAEINSRNSDSFFSARPLMEEQQLKLHLKNLNRHIYPSKVLFFGFPLLKINSSIVIIPNHDVKEQEQMGVFPSLIRFKNEKVIVTQTPHKVNEITVTMFNIEWKLSTYQRSIERTPGHPLTTLCTVCSVNINNLPFWFHDVRSGSDFPTCKVFSISDPTVSVLKMIFSPPLLEIYLRCYTEVTKNNTYMVPNDCMLKLGFVNEIIPNEISLTVHMHYFKICSDKRKIDVFFQDTMLFDEGETKKLHFKGTFYNFNANALYVPDPNSKVQSIASFWSPTTSLTTKVTSDRSQRVTTNDIIGSIYFIPTHILRTKFDPNYTDSFAAEIELNSEDPESDALYFLADKIFISDLPDLILRKGWSARKKKLQSGSNINNHAPSKSRLRF